MRLSFQLQTPMPAAAEALYQWHASGGAFERLCPPWQDIRVVNWAGGSKTSDQPTEEQFGDISTGTRVFLKNQVGPFYMRIEAEHVAHKTGSHFIDEMRRGPFSYWRHTHSFIPSGESSSMLDDSVEFELPFEPFSRIAHGMATKEIRRMFDFRHWRTHRDIELHQRWQDGPRQSILIVGDGMVALHLGAFLRNGGHSVHHVATQAMTCRAHTVLDTLEPEHFAGTAFDSIVFCHRLELGQSPAVLESVFQAVSLQGVKVVLFLGEESLSHSEYTGQVRCITLRIPSIWDGGYLCCPNRDPATVIPGWCALDDLLGGIEEMVMNENWEGGYDWCAPSPIDVQALRTHGVGIRGLPFRVPHALFNALKPSVLQHGISVAKGEYQWLEPRFFETVY